jgi:hypothetical protein
VPVAVHRWLSPTAGEQANFDSAETASSPSGSGGVSVLSVVPSSSGSAMAVLLGCTGAVVSAELAPADVEVLAQPASSSARGAATYDLARISSAHHG